MNDKITVRYSVTCYYNLDSLFQAVGFYFKTYSMNNIVKIVLFSLLFLPYYAYCEEVATLFSAEGTVEALIAPNKSWKAVKKGAAFNAHDSIRTGSGSRAGILFADGVVVRLNANTALQLEKGSNSEQPLKVEKGELYSFSRKPTVHPAIHTSSVSAAIRGTEFTVAVSATGTVISVIDGAVQAANKFGSVAANGGEKITAFNGKAPSKAILLKPLDAAQWTFYYPKLGHASSTKAVGKVEQALTSGDVVAAETLLKSAEMPKAVGKAYSAIILLAKNQKAEALALAEQAVADDQKSATAQIALSFARQAHFDLTGAAEAAKKAHGIEPNNGEIFSRLAELELANGNTEEARKLAAQAVSIEPSSVRAITTLGFAELLNFEPAKATDRFKEALSVEDNFGLAYLGLGLAMIRQGELAAGRAELQKAAAIEPNSSLYRSYLGKAYFEEEREDLAGSEYDRAIALDPNDPTPYLYRAFNNLSGNNVVGALDDVEDSISRNRNRAVFRSALLLDQDAAVRSAGLAEVFKSLGFEKVAKVEAVKAINKDYGNYSAHRFLADSSSSLELSDAAISEYAIAGLLSPLSFNLFTTSSGSAGLNEYNALFERPENRGNLSMQWSTYQDRLTPEVFLSGRTEKMGYLIGGQGTYANGDSPGDYDEDQRVRGSFQYQLTPSDRIVVSANYQDTGNESIESALFDTRYEKHDINLGYQHKIDAGSQLIFQLSHRDTRDRLHGSFVRSSLVDLVLDGEAEQYEDNLLIDSLVREDIRDARMSVQYYRDSTMASVVFGAESYYANPHRYEDGLIAADDLGIFDGTDTELNSEGERDLNSQNIYLYPTFHLAEWVDLTVGGKYSELQLEKREFAPFKDEGETRTAWNPKIGASFYITPSLTLRAAYFEGLRKSAIEDVGSLEPTTVGGLNQVFADFSGVRSTNTGVGVDYKLAKSTYMGVEIFKRHYVDKYNDFLNTFAIDFDQGTQTEQLDYLDPVDLHTDQIKTSAYLYQIFSRRIVGTLDYTYDSIENTHPEIAQDFKLHKLGAFLRYFDRTGWFLFGGATWRKQERENGFFLEDGSDDFVLANAGIGMRLPSRHGSLTLAVNNIFNREFSYDQSFGLEEAVIPERYGVLSVNFNF